MSGTITSFELEKCGMSPLTFVKSKETQSVSKLIVASVFSEGLRDQNSELRKATCSERGVIALCVEFMDEIESTK